MSVIEWTYRWEGHEAHIQMRRDSHPWDRLYLDGVLAAEQRGWHLLPIALTAQAGHAGRDNHPVHVRVGWGCRCRISIDSVLSCYALSNRWFLLQSGGHTIEVGYREWYVWRRVHLLIDGELVAATVGKGAPSKLGIVVEGTLKRRTVRSARL